MLIKKRSGVTEKKNVRDYKFKDHPFNFSTKVKTYKVPLIK